MAIRSLVLALVALPVTLPAAQLPVRAYNAADGLASNTIEAIIKDSRGYLWFATREGLSRFDGSEFTSYDRRKGLQRNTINDFLETRAGEYWAATNAGVARFEPNAAGDRKFTVVVPEDIAARRVNVLYEDRAGTLWCGADGGLFRLHAKDAGRRNWRLDPVAMILPADRPIADRRVISLFEDSHGDFWIGTMGGLYRRQKDGPLSEYHLPEGSGADEVWNQVLEDRKGSLWAGTGIGLFRLAPDGHNGYRLQPVLVPKQRTIVWRLLEDAAGALWMGTSSGLFECQGGGDRCAMGVRVYAEANGLTYRDVRTLATDSAQNLWLGTDGGGAMRIAQTGALTYTADDGVSFGTKVKPALFKDRLGTVGIAFQHILNVPRGRTFLEVKLAVPDHIKNFGWGWHQTVLQDHTGDWWVATGEGLVRFPNAPMEALQRTKPKAVYTTRDGLRTNDVFRVFEDSKGGIWVGSIGSGGVNGLSRWDQETNRFHRYPIHDSTVASAFVEDRNGSIWIGYFDGALARIRGGEMTLYSSADGLAGGAILALHVTRSGSLWIASAGGLTRVDTPGEAAPRFQRFGTEQGLSSNVILCLGEDRWGGMYLATGRGMDRVNPDGEIAPGRVHHFTQADGLAHGDLSDILFDRDGVLWCATVQGISRFIPKPEIASPPQPVLIRQIRVRGVSMPLSDLGQAFVPQLSLGPDQNQLQIDFAANAFVPGEVLRYEYRLDPADHEWSPSAQRTVNYSNVPPGKYRFSVRRISNSNAVPNPAAILEFAVMAPVWARWWFRLLAVCTALLLLHAFYRFRTRRLLELERVRTRIAADLHDDIGSGLSQIAVLTEVARARARTIAAELDPSLGDIGSLSRELAESMNDIVWSVNPKRDRVTDLVQRMRRFASDVLSGSNIDFTFTAPIPDEGARISTEVRREVYLIFKEAVNNLVRHSACERAEITISIEHGNLELRVEDNGNGLGLEDRDGGQGLRNMSARAHSIAGVLEFGRADSGGVRVVLRAPIAGPRRRRQLPV